MIKIIGYHSTKFGELWDKSLFDLVEETIEEVLKATRLEKKEIDAIFFGNMLAGVLENNLHSPSKIAEFFKTNLPIYRSEAACASGGVAFHLAKTYLDAYPDKTVLVIGAEKMTDYSPEETTAALAAAASGEEQEAGLTFPGLYALMTQVYFQKYQATENDLAYVAYKNHYHGCLNKNAHFQRQISVAAILKSAYIAYPLKVLDCSPISDGACSLVLTNKKSLIKKISAATVLTTEVASDTIFLKNRQSLDAILATKIAADKAFSKAKLKRSAIQVAEVHDCFTIGEILAMEDLGFWKKGTAGKKMSELSTLLGKGNLTVNTSGGLKAAGHPVGATGIKQIGEIFLQLTGQAEKRQVKNVRYGLAQNIGGSGGTAVVTILGN